LTDATIFPLHSKYVSTLPCKNGYYFCCRFHWHLCMRDLENYFTGYAVCILPKLGPKSRDCLVVSEVQCSSTLLISADTIHLASYARASRWIRYSRTSAPEIYGSSAGNTVDENSSVLSMNRMRQLPQQRHASSKTSIQRNPPNS